jgi:hypothetical protein
LRWCDGSLRQQRVELALRHAKLIEQRLQLRHGRVELRLLRGASRGQLLRREAGQPQQPLGFRL